MISSFLIISLAGLLIISSLFNTHVYNREFNDSYFINDYLFKQSEALKEYTYLDLDYDLYFNEFAHINKAKSLNINDKKIIITLGNGRIHYE